MLKYDKLLNDLEDKVLKLSEENQKLIERLNIKSEENNEIYIMTIKNDEKYNNMLSKDKHQIKKLRNNNRIILKRFKYSKKSINVDKTKLKTGNNTNDTWNVDKIKTW